MKVARTLRLVGATGELRTAMFQEREHLVVPVIALVEGVVWAVNSEAPELVLAEELRIATAGWNGRPIVGDHPSDGPHKISANSPLVLERESFGCIFNAEVVNDRLAIEAWLDPARADKVGRDAQRVLERARNGEPIEVSVGVYMTLEAKSGTYKGKTYAGIWRGLVPDHLAMLPEGMTGACSVEMGCGAPRAAAAYLVTAGGLIMMSPTVAQEEVPVSVPAVQPVPAPVVAPSVIPIASAVAGDPTAVPPIATAAATEEVGPVGPVGPEGVAGVAGVEEPIKRRSLRERLGDLLTFRSNAGTASDMSDVDLRNAIEKALRATEPGYMWIESVFPADSVVIFSAMPADNLQLFRRNYSVKRDGSIKFGDTREEVEPVTTFEPVAASAAAETTQQPTTAGCGCAKEGAHAMDKAQRVQALISNPKTPFADSDKAYLETLSDDRLVALESFHVDTPVTAAAAEPVVTPAPVATPVLAAVIQAQPAAAPIVQGASPVTAEQYIANAPIALQESLREGMRIAEDKRNGIIASLKATGRCDYTDQELAALSTHGLERLVKLASVPAPEMTYAGRALSRTGEESAVPGPPDMIGEMRAASKK